MVVAWMPKPQADRQSIARCLTAALGSVADSPQDVRNPRSNRGVTSHFCLLFMRGAVHIPRGLVIERGDTVFSVCSYKDHISLLHLLHF
jgi:hypothetical protein